MNLSYLQKKNPDYHIHTVNEAEFQRYGRVCAYDTSAMIQYVKESIALPNKGSTYEADREDLHRFAAVAAIQKDIYGELAIEAGICHGHNHTLEGLEYHVGSEVNIAVSDCILALGRKEDIQGHGIDGEKLELFYVPAQTTIELKEGTLHYCPFSADSSGFSTIVILLDKTNTAIPYHAGDVLTKRNKWFLAHTSNKKKIEAGNVAGLLGEPISIRL